MNLFLSIITPIITFVGGGLFGFLLPQIQKPLTDYRNALVDISRVMLKNVHVMYEPRDRAQPPSDEARDLYRRLRHLHAVLLSSANSIPRFARPILQKLGLLQSRAQIEEGAEKVIGISNQMITANKDMPHLTKMIEQLKAALDIAA